MPHSRAPLPIGWGEAERFINCASAFDCFFPWGAVIGAERKPSGSWNGFLRAPLSLWHREPEDIHEGQVDLFCSEILFGHDLV